MPLDHISQDLDVAFGMVQDGILSIQDAADQCFNIGGKREPVTLEGRII